MKRFEFPLARVRDFRRQQLELEEIKLQPLFAERKVLESESARLKVEASDTRQSLMVIGSVESQDLAASDKYLRHLASQTLLHGARLADWQARAAERQQAVVEARRRVRLMEKLEERQFRQWQADVDREQENLSAELYLARWKPARP